MSAPNEETPPSDQSMPGTLERLALGSSPLGFVVWAVAEIGEFLGDLVSGFGQASVFALRALTGIFIPRSWFRSDRIGRQLFFVGTTSVPVVALTGGFIGMILAFEGYRQFQSIGQETRLGAVINLSMLKQIGPVLAAVMLAGRVGCALTAELGTMRVTEQLDAMRAMGSDPVRVLVTPRLLACIVMIPPLTVVSNLFGVLGGWVIIVKLYGADPHQYIRFSQQFISWYDIMNGLVKSIFFGAAIGIIACWKGFTCKPGAAGVGDATTDSFVTSFIAIIILSLVLAKFLNDVEFLFFGGIQSLFS